MAWSRRSRRIYSCPSFRRSLLFKKDGNYALAFPSFGPERRGAPIRAFTKLDTKKVGNRAEIEKADFAVYLDDTLFNDDAFLELKENGKSFFVPRKYSQIQKLSPSTVCLLQRKFCTYPLPIL